MTPSAGAALPITHVVAGILRDAHGRVLLAQRGEGRHLAGMWEFPGGKVDSGETPLQALVRELGEELGVVVSASRPLIVVEHQYPSRRILLDVHEVLAHTGEPRGMEGQALRWLRPDDMVELPMPDADRPVVKALRLPTELVVTPEPGDVETFLSELERTLERGARMLQLRTKTLEGRALSDLATRALARCRAHAATLLLNGTPQLALDLGLDGVHLDARRLADLSRRPLPSELWVGASCHDRRSVERAAGLGLDYATLSPVACTLSHPGSQPLGWSRFAELRAGIALPVFALGGLRPDDLDQARSHGAQGVAGIRQFWCAAADGPAASS